jgi:hypothetical protein
MYCIFWQPAFSSEPHPPQTGHNFTGQKGLFNPKSRETRNLGGIDGPIPRGPVSPCPSHMAERALIEWRSRLFKPCFSTCSSGALHLVNWPPLQRPQWRHLGVDCFQGCWAGSGLPHSSTLWCSFGASCWSGGPAWSGAAPAAGVARCVVSGCVEAALEAGVHSKKMVRSLVESSVDSPPYVATRPQECLYHSGNQHLRCSSREWPAGQYVHC